MKSKERFIEIMEVLREQHDSDRDYAKDLGEAMGTEINPYNNSLLVNCLVDELASWFEYFDSKPDILRFIYELDFGRRENYSIGDVYVQLNYREDGIKLNGNDWRNNATGYGFEDIIYGTKNIN